MNTCETCVFWRRDEKEHRAAALDITDEHHEPVVPQPFDVRTCTSPKLRMYERPEIDGAATLDGSQYWSALYTGPQFGCVHHAAHS